MRPRDTKSSEQDTLQPSVETEADFTYFAPASSSAPIEVNPHLFKEIDNILASESFDTLFSTPLPPGFLTSTPHPLLDPLLTEATENFPLTPFQFPYTPETNLSENQTFSTPFSSPSFASPLPLAARQNVIFSDPIQASSLKKNALPTKKQKKRKTPSTQVDSVKSSKKKKKYRPKVITCKNSPGFKTFATIFKDPTIEEYQIFCKISKSDLAEISARHCIRAPEGYYYWTYDRIVNCINTMNVEKIITLANHWKVDSSSIISEKEGDEKQWQIKRKNFAYSVIELLNNPTYDALTTKKIPSKKPIIIANNDLSHELKIGQSNVSAHDSTFFASSSLLSPFLTPSVNDLREENPLNTVPFDDSVFNPLHIPTISSSMEISSLPDTSFLESKILPIKSLTMKNLLELKKSALVGLKAFQSIFENATLEEYTLFCILSMPNLSEMTAQIYVTTSQNCLNWSLEKIKLVKPIDINSIKNLMENWKTVGETILAEWEENKIPLEVILEKTQQLFTFFQEEKSQNTTSQQYISDTQMQKIFRATTAMEIIDFLNNSKYKSLMVDNSSLPVQSIPKRKNPPKQPKRLPAKRNKKATTMSPSIQNIFISNGFPLDDKMISTLKYNKKEILLLTSIDNLLKSGFNHKQISKILLYKKSSETLQEKYDILKMLGFDNNQMFNMAKYPNGYKNLNSVIDNFQKLIESNVSLLSMVKIASQASGFGNIECLVQDKNELLKLHFSEEQIIRLFSYNRGSFGCFLSIKAIIKYSSVLRDLSFTNEQFILLGKLGIQSIMTIVENKDELKEYQITSEMILGFRSRSKNSKNYIEINEVELKKKLDECRILAAAKVLNSLSAQDNTLDQKALSSPLYASQQVEESSPLYASQQTEESPLLHASSQQVESPPFSITSSQIRTHSFWQTPRSFTSIESQDNCLTQSGDALITRAPK
jgi:hypothetical protein